MNKSKKESKKIIILITILLIIDQVVKIIINITNYQKTLNNGIEIKVIETLESGNRIEYILISIIAIIVLINYIRSNNTYIKTTNKIVISFAIAGVMSNLIDRIYKGYVINYIYIPKFVPINLAYIYMLITWIGMAIILTKYTKERIKERKQQGGNKKG